MSFFVENAWVIPALPLWIFLIILFGTNTAAYDNKKISSYITIGATFIGLIFSSFILAWTIANPTAHFEVNFNWLQVGQLKFSTGWLVDNLSAMMLMVVTSVSLLIQIYSQEYMKEDDGYHRFFAYLALFNFSMLGLVISTNLFQTYIFWELVGLSSYLLIGFWFARPSAANAAKKAFIMNRIGDFGLLIGIIAFLFFSFNWWNHNNVAYLSFTSLSPAINYVLDNHGTVVIGLIALAMLMGPIAKSAQFPLYTWLPDAMEGPTPISALIHAATMVAAGIYLIARAYPIFQLSPEVMALMTGIGAVTAILTAIVALTQVDIKRILAYSTCSQLGFMVMAMGIGSYSAGLFHLMTHAYFKAMLFLCAGAVIHSLSDQQDVKYMGGLRKYMPSVAYTYLIGTLAISGIFLSGFWSKDEILTGLLNNGYRMIFTLSLITSGMTAFYMFRSYFLTFEGEYKGHAHPHSPSKMMTAPLIILAVPSAIIGFALSGNLSKFISFNHFIEPLAEAYEHPASMLVPALSLLASLIGFALAAMFYWDKFFIRANPDKLKNKIIGLYNVSQSKWYLDDIYNAFINKIFLPVSSLIAWIDKYIVDGIVNLVAYIVKLSSLLFRLFQNGNVSTYVTILFGGFTVITIFIIVHWIL